MAKIFNAIGRFLENLFGDVSEETWHTISLILIWLVAAAFLSTLIIVILRLIQHPPARVPKERVQILSPMQSRKSPEELMALAEEAAASSRYQEALRNVYMASIMLLDHAELLAYADSGTNWEYLRAVRAHGQPEQAEIMLGLTVAFDTLIYGHHEITCDDYQLAIGRYRRLEGTL